MSTTPTPEAPSPELLRMHNAGQLLANCAFNIAQHAGEPVSESVAATLKQCQNEWDAACLAFKKARAALTQGAGAAVEPVAYAHQAVLDWLADPARGKSAHTATELHKSGNGFAQVALYAAPPAQQLQQAVAREREAACQELHDQIEALRYHCSDATKRDIAERCLLDAIDAIRAKGTHD
jgi:hypothetical protein